MLRAAIVLPVIALIAAVFGFGGIVGDEPCFNILAHATGRRIGQRAPFDVDLEQVIAVALERGCLLESNAYSERLDLDGVHANVAKDMGLK